MSKNCRKRHLDILEEDSQEEGRKRKVGKKERKRNAIIKEVIKGSQKMMVKKVLKDEGTRTGGPNSMQSWDCSQMKKRRKAGKKATNWQNN